MKFSGNKSTQCRDAAAGQEDDGHPDTAAVYRSVRLFCYVLDKTSWWQNHPAGERVSPLRH